MPEGKKWSAGAKMVAVAAAGLLLTIGLCSAGTPFMGQGGSSFRDGLQAAGFITGILSLLLLAIGLFVALIGWISRDR